MTPEDFANRMRLIEIREADDPEAAHSDADDLMAQVLRQLGYGVGIDIFHALKKWYA